MLCEMCGSEGNLFKTIIEEAQLNVCHECSRFGKVIGIIEQKEPEVSAKRKNIDSQPEVMQIITENYTQKIREKRESLGLTQKELAKKISEKESLIQKIESGHFEPPLSLAKKIEKFLKVKLMEEYKDDHEKQAGVKIDSFTIGDFVKK